jgi:ribosome biogenesis GTPase A
MPKKKPKKKKQQAEKGEQQRAFSWYPGHMVKAKRELESNLKLADAVLVMLDSRAPISTRHHDLEQILASRSCPFGLVLNKSDIAEQDQTEKWCKHLRSEGHSVVRMNSVLGRGPGALTSLLDRVGKAVNDRRERKGLLPREPRLMVCGLPNSGKSTLLNRLVGKTRFKAGKKPGLTRGAQWVRVANRYHLLDTPGILYPRIEGERSLSVLAAVGSVKRNVLPQEKVAQTLLKILRDRGRLSDFVPDLESVEWEQQPLVALASLWGFQTRGEEEPTRRAFERLLNLLTDKDKPITWEFPPEAAPE